MRACLRRLSCLLFAGAITGGALAAGPVVAASAAATGGTAVCSGSPSSPGELTGAYPGNVVVKGACEVNAGVAVVSGNLNVSQGSVLLAAFALNDKTGSGKSSLTVHGDLQVGIGATVLLGCNPQNFACLDDPNQSAPTLSSHDSVGQDMSSYRPLGVIVHNTSIGGDLSQYSGGGGVNCTPSGVFKLFNSPVYSAYEHGSVAGDVNIAGVHSCWLGLATLQVGGGVLIRHNKLADPDAIEILANHIDGNLVCLGNSRTWDSAEARMGHLFPRVPQPNTVDGRRGGQCVLSSPTKPGGPHGPGPF
jgi:hypothetical protein